MSNYETVISNETLCGATENKAENQNNLSKQEKLSKLFPEDIKTKPQDFKHYEALLFYNLP